MQIDGWANSGKNYENPAILDNVKTMLDKRTSILDANISKVENELSVAKGRRKIELEADLKDLTDSKTTIEKNLGIFKSNPKAAATFMQREAVINNTVARFSPLFTESISTKKDEYYWAKKNYELKLAECERKTYEGQIGDVIQTSLGAVTEEDLPAIEKAIDTQFNELSETINKAATGIKYQLEQEAQAGNPEAKAQLDLLNKKIKAKTADQTELDVIKEFVADTNYTNNPLLLLDDNGNDLRATMNDAIEQYTLYDQGLKMARKKALDRHVDKTLNTEEYFEAVNSNENTKMLWNGRAVPVHEVLKREGLMDADGNKIGDIKSKPEVLKQLQMSYLIDASINEATKLKHSSPQGQKPGFLYNESRRLNELANTLGETTKEIFGIKKGEEDKIVSLEDLDPNSKTAQYIKQGFDNEIYDTTSLYDFFQDVGSIATFGITGQSTDQSLSGDDTDIGKYINEDYRKDELYIREIDKFRQKLGN
jgi:hypothetical protein